MRSVLFEVNGEPRVVQVRDDKATPDDDAGKTEKADPIDDGSVGSPLSGVVVSLKVSKGDAVEKGQPLAVMSVRAARRAPRADATDAPRCHARRAARAHRILTARTPVASLRGRR